MLLLKTRKDLKFDLQKINVFICIMVLCYTCTGSGSGILQLHEKSVIIDSLAVYRIDSLFNELVESGDIAGISALIHEKDKEVYYNAFGYADREAKIPMDRNTIVQIWSMTKPIVGTALMTLYEEGAFRLDDPVSKYAEEFKDLKVYAGLDNTGVMILETPKRPLTIRDLTRHTAGFVNSPDIPVLGTIWEKVLLAQKLGQIPLWFHPGEKWAYGISVDVQAFLVERISNQPFNQYLRSNVLDPLGMTETRYYVPEEDRHRLAAVYRRFGEGDLRRIPDEEALSYNTHHWPLTPGGYGLTSTLDDYMKFARMLLHEGTLDEVRILKPETIQLMTTNHLPDSVEERSWLPDRGQVGFGINFAVRVAPPVSEEENKGVVGEFFWDGAASTLFWVDPKNELIAVMFVQLFPYDQIGLHNKFRDSVYGDLNFQSN
jgi:CubicO group peptidase (beta-lactamase class C family)